MKFLDDITPRRAEFSRQLEAERSGLPGDTTLTLTREAVASDGTRLPSGSLVQPVSFGYRKFVYNVIRVAAFRKELNYEKNVYW